MAVRKATRMRGARGQLRTRPVVSPASLGRSAGDWDEVDSHPACVRTESKAEPPPKSPARPGGRGLPWGAGGFCKHKLVPFSLQQLHVNLVIILASRWSLLDPDQS